MDPTTKAVTERRAWKALVAHYQNVRDLHVRKLFADDPTRGKRMTTEAVGLYLDYPKNRVTDETLNAVGLAGAYAFYAIASAILLPSAWAAVRETKAKTLEQMKLRARSRLVSL